MCQSIAECGASIFRNGFTTLDGCCGDWNGSLGPTCHIHTVEGDLLAILVFWGSNIAGQDLKEPYLLQVARGVSEWIRAYRMLALQKVPRPPILGALEVCKLSLKCIEARKWPVRTDA